MAPMYGFPNYDFLDENSGENDQKVEVDTDDLGLTEMAFWYTIVLIVLLIIWLFVFFCLRILSLRQKTRNTQQRRPYMGTRSRSSLTPSDPSIYVSPANLPPPPKYEHMAPPSYEEVVGVHYPSYQPQQIQPITQPITVAMMQNANASAGSNAEGRSGEATASCTNTTQTITEGITQRASVSTITNNRNAETTDNTVCTPTITVTNERREVIVSS